MHFPRKLRGLCEFGMDQSLFMAELPEDFVGKIGKKKIGETGEPCLGLGSGDRTPDEPCGVAIDLVAIEKDLFDGKDPIGEPPARIGRIGLGIRERSRSQIHVGYLTSHLKRCQKDCFGTASDHTAATFSLNTSAEWKVDGSDFAEEARG